MQFLIEIVLFVLVLPVAFLWLMVRVFKEVIQDLAKFFGYWLYPAVLSLYAGVVLSAAGPTGPDAVFGSPLQVIAEMTVWGVGAAAFLLCIAVVFLAIGAVRGISRRGRSAASRSE